MLKIDRQNNKPIWKQLLDQAVHNITSGKWKSGYKLMPTRELAEQLGVARSTVQAVYEELYSRGYTVTSRRGGTRVSDWNQPILSKEERSNYRLNPPTIPALDEAISQLQDWSGRRRKHDADINFSPYDPYLDPVFLKKWRQSFIHASDEADLSSWSYGDTFGYEPLRRQIQNYLSVERGIHVDMDQILLTSGTQQSIDLISQSLVLEGDTAAVEDPGFPPAWLTMIYRNLNVVPVPVDERGIVTDDIPEQSKLIFVTPSHQSATGVVMTVKRRRQLFETAIRNQSWIIEDDYDSEFRYSGDPLPTLFSQEPECTLYLMSFSKLIAPGIRISAIIGPVKAIAQIGHVQRLTSRQLPIMEQLTLAHFIEHGHFMRHMRRIRNVYRRRHEAMIKAINSSKLGEVFSVKGVETGLHMLLEADGDFNEEEMTNKALAEGVNVYPLSTYCLESKRKGWVLGYSKVDEETIMRGISRLSDII